MSLSDRKCLLVSASQLCTEHLQLCVEAVSRSKFPVTLRVWKDRGRRGGLFALLSRTQTFCFSFSFILVLMNLRISPAGIEKSFGVEWGVVYRQKSFFGGSQHILVWMRG